MSDTRPVVVPSSCGRESVIGHDAFTLDTVGVGYTSVRDFSRFLCIHPRWVGFHYIVRRFLVHFFLPLFVRVISIFLPISRFHLYTNSPGYCSLHTIGTAGKLPRWLPFNGSDPYERWARDLDTAIATARSRAGSFCPTAGRTSFADDLALPDLVAEGETLALSEETQGACASDRPRSAVKQEVMWDTRPKSPDRLVFDPALGVVPWGILDAWARAEREGGNSRSSGGDAGEVAASPDGLACCGNRAPFDRREKNRRVLPPVRYTPEWHAWRKARADSVLAKSAREESVRAESVRVESVDPETEGEKGTEGICPRGGEDGVVEGAAASKAVAIGKNGMPFVPKTWTPAAIDSQFEGVTGGATEDESGKFVEFSTESRDGDESDARPSERCFAPVSTTSPKASCTPPAAQPCL